MTNPNVSMVDWFKACDAAAAVPLTASERATFDALQARASTLGLGGHDRIVWSRLSARRNAK